MQIVRKLRFEQRIFTWGRERELPASETFESEECNETYNAMRCVALVASSDFNKAPTCSRLSRGARLALVTLGEAGLAKSHSSNRVATLDKNDPKKHGNYLINLI